MALQNVMQQMKQFASEKAANGELTGDDVIFGDSNLASPSKRQKLEDKIIKRYENAEQNLSNRH